MSDSVFATYFTLGAIIIAIAAASFSLSEKPAMEKCMEKHSRSTCMYILR